MTFPSTEEVQKLFEQLPPQLQDALFSTETATKVRSICDKNNLNEEQRYAVADEVGLVLMKYSTVEKFSDRVAQRLGMHATQVEKIAQEMGESIFTPLSSLLSKVEHSSPNQIVHQEKSVGHEPNPNEEYPSDADPYHEPVESGSEINAHLQSEQGKATLGIAKPLRQEVAKSIDEQLLRKARGAKVEQPEKQAPAPTNLPIAEKTPETNSSVGDRPTQNNQPDPYREQS